MTLLFGDFAKLFKRSVATSRNLFKLLKKEQMAKSVEWRKDSVKKCDNSCENQKPPAVETWNVCFFLLINWPHLPTNTFYTLHDSWASFQWILMKVCPFLSPFKDRTETAQFSVSNCAESVHFLYTFVHFLYRQRPACKLHVWLFPYETKQGGCCWCIAPPAFVEATWNWHLVPSP